MPSELKKYLDPRVLTKIRNLDLQARLVVEGFISGIHRSPFYGFSVEFAQHREYAPGDDLRHLDWKVLGRTDRLYIKQYEVETNLRCLFLVDVSESMRYEAAADSDGQRPSKFRHAGCLACCLGLLLLNQQDAVGLATFDDQLRAYVPISSHPNQIKSFAHELDTAGLEAKTDLAAIVRSLGEKLPRRAMVCLISDLLVPPESLREALEFLRHHGHEVMVLHVMDRDELELPFQGHVQFRGMEGLGELLVEPRALRGEYLAALREFLAQTQRICTHARADYRLISTADYLDGALTAFLAARAAAVRKRGAKR